MTSSVVSFDRLLSLHVHTSQTYVHVTTVGDWRTGVGLAEEWREAYYVERGSWSWWCQLANDLACAMPTESSSSASVI